MKFNLPAGTVLPKVILCYVLIVSWLIHDCVVPGIHN